MIPATVKPERDVLPHHLPLHEVPLPHALPAFFRADQLFPVRDVLVFFLALVFLQMLPRLLDKFIRSGDADEEPGEADQEQPTQVLANDELPREENGDDDAKLDDEIR